jgi:GAF domain-containing protein
VPRSIAAAPLLDEDGTIGVLQVLDKRSTATFSLQDMELIGVFAAQATVAIAAAKVMRDTTRLVAASLADLDGETSEDDIEAVVSRVTAGLDTDDDSPFWKVVDQVARLRGLTDRELTLVADILAVVAADAERHRGRPRR